MARPFVLFQIGIAAIAAPAALLLWFAFVRQVPEQSGMGTIRAKTFLDAHTITRYPSNAFRQSWTPMQIRINEAYVFDISLEGAGNAFFALDTLGSKAYEVGQKIPVRYEVRGLGPLWKKIRIKGIGPQ